MQLGFYQVHWRTNFLFYKKPKSIYLLISCLFKINDYDLVSIGNYAVTEVVAGRLLVG
jgi:hypothetical protein